MRRFENKYLLTHVDGRNSHQKVVSFYDFIVEKMGLGLNGEDYVVRTEKLPCLQNHSSEQVAISKGDYTLSQKKARNSIAQIKPNNLDFCWTYKHVEMVAT